MIRGTAIDSDKRKRILIIDDEEALCRVIKLNLEHAGEYEVITAYSGEEGLDKAKAGGFDVIITDFNMPGIDGITVLNTIKGWNPEQPVALFSIYYDDSCSFTADTRNKADALISKPIDYDQLKKIIDDLINKKSL